MTYLYRAGLGAVIAALLFGGPQLSAVDQPKTDPIVKDIQQMLAAYPNNIQLLFENEYVWVLEYRLRPGDALPVHDLGNHAVYALGDPRDLAHPLKPALASPRASSSQRGLRPIADCSESTGPSAP